jgi:hypothetical protein
MKHSVRLFARDLYYAARGNQIRHAGQADPSDAAARSSTPPPIARRTSARTQPATATCCFPSLPTSRPCGWRERKLLKLLAPHEHLSFQLAFVTRVGVEAGKEPPMTISGSGPRSRAGSMRFFLLETNTIRHHVYGREPQEKRCSVFTTRKHAWRGITTISWWLRVRAAEADSKDVGQAANSSPKHWRGAMFG